MVDPARQPALRVPGRRHSADLKRVAGSLLSVAGLIGRPVSTPDQSQVGVLVDVVIRWDAGTYPPVAGLVVKVGRRRVFVPNAQVGQLSVEGAVLSTTRLDLRELVRRPGEALLLTDVVDHQLVDVDGLRVIRAADLYLAQVADDTWCLVGADVSMTSLLRRLGPRRWRARPTPEQVIDWAAIQPFGGPGRELHLRRPNEALHRLRPAELADLLEELGRTQRAELLRQLDPDVAADVLEEMERSEVGAVLHEADSAEGAALLGDMETDEAVDALRDLTDHDRERLLAAMPRPDAAELQSLLDYAPDVAGGIMTTTLVTTTASLTVAQAVALLRENAAHAGEIDGIVLVDETGAAIDEISLFELLLADPAQSLQSMVGPPWPTTVSADAPLDEVIEQLTANRGYSVLVVDEQHRPLGRIMADDVVDALRRPGRPRGTRWAR